jgi:hypothetical protein
MKANLFGWNKTYDYKNKKQIIYSKAWRRCWASPMTTLTVVTMQHFCYPTCVWPDPSLWRVLPPWPRSRPDGRNCKSPPTLEHVQLECTLPAPRLHAPRLHAPHIGNGNLHPATASRQQTLIFTDSRLRRRCMPLSTAYFLLLVTLPVFYVSRKHDVSGTGSVSILRWEEGDTYFVGSLRKS